MGDFEGTAEAIILVKASPQVGRKHGETVCCAGVNSAGEWVRLYPVTFRTLDEANQFGRWDRIRFRWRRPSDDPRIESRHIDHQSIEIIGQLKPRERLNFLAPLEVTSLNQARADGKSLALLRPRNPKFVIESKSEEAIAEEKRNFESFAAQDDLFNSKPLIPYGPCPFRFKYRYTTDDGEREGTCQDWETDATFFNWRRLYDEQSALEKMQKVFGEEYPSKGMVFAMGTHSLYPETWLINGIIRMDEVQQMALALQGEASEGDVVAVDRQQWAEKFGALPHWRCPTCNKGHLLPMNAKVWFEETGPSIEEHSHEAWDPDWIINRFAGFLQCNMPSCKEVASISGNSPNNYFENYDEDEHIQELKNIFVVKSIYPSPIPIQMPQKTPEPIVEAVMSASGLIWSSSEAAGNQIRQTVELMLDEFGIPSKSGNGKRITLHSRIEEFAKIDPENGDILLATKWLGNSGSHAGGITRDDVLDAFDMVEYVLESRFGTTKKDLMAKVAAVNAKKGPVGKAKSHT